MAAIMPVDCVLVSPPGETGIDKGYASTAVVAGDPIVITSTTPPNRQWEQVVAKASGTLANGIALKDCGIGGTIEYAYRGEVDGYAGMTRGAALTIVGGNVDDTAPAAGVETQIRAITPSRIRFNLI